jgi:hypothetical protein
MRAPIHANPPKAAPRCLPSNFPFRYIWHSQFHGCNNISPQFASSQFPLAAEVCSSVRGEDRLHVSAALRLAAAARSLHREFVLPTASAVVSSPNTRNG